MSIPKKILNFALDRSCPFIYASSAAVYGEAIMALKRFQKVNILLIFMLFQKFLLINMLEKLLNKTSQIVGLRYFNVYGPQENHKTNMASQIFNLYNQLKNNNKMNIFEGSKNFLRDFIHVDDVVDVNMFFLNTGISGIYNCGSGVTNSFYRLQKF